MQLSLKRKGDYAVRAMISVGRHYGTGLRQARQISTEMHIPYKTLTLILAGLVAEGLLEANHGPKGGYRLARDPSEISLLDIVEAAEGPATFDHCVLRDGPCDWEETCPVHDIWARTQDALIRELASTSLATSRQSTPPSKPVHTRPKPLPILGPRIDTASATNQRIGGEKGEQLLDVWPECLAPRVAHMSEFRRRQRPRRPGD